MQDRVDASHMHDAYPMPLGGGEAGVPHDAPRPEPPRAGRRWSPRPKHGVDGPTSIASLKGQTGYFGPPEMEGKSGTFIEVDSTTHTVSPTESMASMFRRVFPGLPR